MYHLFIYSDFRYRKLTSKRHHGGEYATGMSLAPEMVRKCHRFSSLPQCLVFSRYVTCVMFIAHCYIRDVMDYIKAYSKGLTLTNRQIQYVTNRCRQHQSKDVKDCFQSSCGGCVAIGSAVWRNSLCCDGSR